MTPQAFSNGIIIGTAVTTTTGLLSIFLIVATTNNTKRSRKKNVSLFIYSQSVSRQPDFIFLVDFVPGGDGQNCIVKVRFIGNQYKHQWFNYSIAITLRN